MYLQQSKHVSKHENFQIVLYDHNRIIGNQ